MPSITPARLRSQIKSGKTDPLYAIVGDDEVGKASLAAEFAGIVDPELRAFNVERLYAGDAKVTAATVVFSARTLPLMSSKRVVLVLQAEKLLMPKREGEAADRDAEVLLEYFSSPEPQTALVLVAAGLDERRRTVKALIQRATICECGGLSSGAEAERWARDYVGEQGLSIEPKALAALIARSGTDAARLRADLERLCLFAMGEPAITLAHVYQVASPATAEGEFALVNAIERGASGQALRELALLMEAGEVPFKILGQLAWYVRSRLGSGVRTAIEAVMRTDIALKTSAGDHRVLLERLVVELCDDKLRARVVKPGALF
jgi:DNA polymerase III subunit delta